MAASHADLISVGFRIMSTYINVRTCMQRVPDSTFLRYIIRRVLLRAYETMGCLWIYGCSSSRPTWKSTSLPTLFLMRRFFNKLSVRTLSSKLLLIWTLMMLFSINNIITMERRKQLHSNWENGQLKICPSTLFTYVVRANLQIHFCPRKKQGQNQVAIDLWNRIRRIVVLNKESTLKIAKMQKKQLLE